MRNVGALAFLLFATLITGFLAGVAFNSHMNSYPQTCARVSYGMVCWKGIQHKNYDRY